MEEFKYLSTQTTYAFKATSEIYGNYERKMSSDACFAEAFRTVNDNYKVTYTLVIMKGLDYLKRRRESNGCLLDKARLHNFIRLAYSICDFKFSVKEKPYYSQDAYYVTLHVDGQPNMVHRYILTWIRYAFEFPYNMLVLDAYELRKRNPFKYETMANLMTLAISSSPCIYRSIHQIQLDEGLFYRMTNRQLKDMVYQKTRLNFIYEKVLTERVDKFPYYIHKDGKQYSPNDLEYWLYGFTRRIPCYLKNNKLRLRR